jgi:lysophospholipase L1-like esterase
VKVTVGDDDGTADLAIRAECRRMMVNRIQTTKGQHKTVEFTVHIRDSVIHTSNKLVKLKRREHDYLHWDNKLTLEFAGTQPKVNAIEIMPANDVTTVFLAGNSTVVDGANEPWSAWGQMIPAFFEGGKVAIANYAESGETLGGFIAERRFEKMLSLMKPGDYALVEFGHNDQKQKGEGIGAFTSYKKDLQYFIREVKNKGAIPVVVTSVQRRRFDSAGKIEETLGDYPEAGRQTAKEENVAPIDLNAMSKTMYEAWGPEESVKAFVHFPANTFPNQPKALEDNTHFRPFGAYEVAKLMVKGIRDAKLGLAGFILKDIPAIDASKPGSLQDFYWPASGNRSSTKPDGN